MKINKPAWWPECPYPEDIFPMKLEKYPNVVPDPDIRTALSGCLGRHFWGVASGMILQAYSEAVADGLIKEVRDERP